MKFNQVFGHLAVGGTQARHWDAADKVALDGAAAAVEQFKAEPWVFTGDNRHFEQFAGRNERAALAEMTDDQQQALLAW